MEDKKMEIITVKDIDYAILDEIDDYIYTVNVNDGTNEGLSYTGKNMRIMNQLKN